MICPTGEAKYFCKGDSTQKCPTGKSLEPLLSPVLSLRRLIDFSSADLDPKALC